MKTTPPPQRARARQVPKIPKGWRELRVGTIIREGDKWYNPEYEGILQRGWHVHVAHKYGTVGDPYLTEADPSEHLVHIRRITPASALSPDSLKSTHDRMRKL